MSHVNNCDVLALKAGNHPVAAVDLLPVDFEDAPCARLRALVRVIELVCVPRPPLLALLLSTHQHSHTHTRTPSARERTAIS
jgi:hypothetical protein